MIVAPNPPLTNYPTISLDKFKDSINAPLPANAGGTGTENGFRGKLYTVDQYTLTLTTAGTKVDYENQSAKILEYDTTPLGGITTFKTEYERLSLTINGNAYSIDVNELVNRSEIIINNLATNSTKSGLFIYEAHGTGQRGAGRAETTQYFVQALRIYVDVNIIKIMAITTQTYTSNFDIAIGNNIQRDKPTYSFNVAELSNPKYF